MDVTIQYSEAFKNQVVSELESGKLKNLTEAKERYGIRSSCTVKKWLLKYGKYHLIRRVVKVETPDERNEVKELKKEIQKYKRSLAETQAQSIINQAYFEILCEKYGEDKEEFKKKAELKLFSEAEQ